MQDIDNELIWKSLVGNMKAVTECLRKGANIHAANDLALSNAIYMNHIKVTKLLLDNGANSNNYRRPALLSANSVKMVHLLLSHGANLPIRRHYTQNHHWIINAYMQYQKAA